MSCRWMDKVTAKLSKQIATARWMHRVVDVAIASYGAGTMQLFGEIAKEFNLGAVSLSPFAQLAAFGNNRRGQRSLQPMFPTPPTDRPEE